MRNMPETGGIAHFSLDGVAVLSTLVSRVVFDRGCSGFDFAGDTRAACRRRRLASLSIRRKNK